MRMLVSYSFSCCTEEGLVVLEWQSTDCGAPRCRQPVHMARQDTAVPS